jgi:hypothetical protein
MAVDEALLHEGEIPVKTSLGKQRIRRTAAVAAVVSFGLAAFYCGSVFGRGTPETHEAYFGQLKLSNGSVSNLADTIECYSYTGDSCYSAACGPNKGTCNAPNGLWHHCDCVSPAGCVSVDGVCGSKPYEKVAEGFHLQNMKWTWQHMYMPTFHLMDTIATSGAWLSTMPRASSWTLYKLPRNWGGHTGYFLTTEAYPGYTASIRWTTGTALSLRGAYEVALTKQLEPWRLAVRVCSRPDGTIMIGNMDGVWFYLHHFSYNVYGWQFGDPGDGGYWKADKAINGLESCDV